MAKCATVGKTFDPKLHFSLRTCTFCNEDVSPCLEVQQAAREAAMPQEIDRKIADLQAGANEEFIRVRNERENTMKEMQKEYAWLSS